LEETFGFAAKLLFNSTHVSELDVNLQNTFPNIHLWYNKLT